MEIYDYIFYQYIHNSSIHSTLANDSAYTGVYDQLRYLADEDAWYTYGNTSASAIDADNQAIGGKTLAAEILKSFRLLIADKNNTGDQTDIAYPLTFYFGEQDTMMSLISLMMIDYTNDYFKSIPPYGSAMVFELFSTGDNVEVPSNPDDLWVRFSFHNGTDSDAEQLVSFPMFNSGRSKTDMPWRTFQDLFGRIGMETVAEWCSACNSPSSFCRGADGSGITLMVPTAQEQKEKMSPAVAGVIGAIVTLVVAGLLFAAAMLLGGIRLHRVDRSNKSELGGFKGSAKLASDPDLSLAKNGAPPAAGIVSFGDGKKGHERVGSWELMQKEFGKDIGDERRRRSSSEQSFGAIDAVANRPVEPHQRV